MRHWEWKKLGRIFNPIDYAVSSWMQGFAQAPSLLVQKNSVRVFFSTRPPQDKNGLYTSRLAYVDLDRSDLHRVIAIAESPVLSLGQRGAFDEFGTYPMSVAYDGSYIVGYYGGWTRCESVPFNVAVGVAKSYDGGMSFERLGPGPVLGYTYDEPFIISGPKIRRFDDKWILWYIAGKKWILHLGRPEPVYRIRMATSSDGVSWSRIGRDIIPPRIESDEAQASPDVIFQNGVYHMFFCYRFSTDYRSGKRGYRIGYARSVDMINWERNDQLAGLDISESGWDSEMVAYPHIFELDKRIYMLYLGNQVGRYGFGLAVLEGELK